MSIEIGLLILESVLLIVTIILLVYSIKEGKQRNKLLIEVSRATKVLSREEYFLTVIDSMTDAKREIIGTITGRLPKGEDKKLTRNVTEIIEKLSNKGVKVTYLLPKFPDRLHIGYLYSKAGAEVRYSNCVMVHNLRFIVIDEKSVVLGIPELTGEKEATKKGFRIPSEGLAIILKEYFNQCEYQMSFADYLREVMSQTGASTSQIAKEFEIDESGLTEILNKHPVSQSS
jgi:hypothetical protein